MSDSAPDSISISRTVRAAAESSFALFTEGFASWYPSAYTWSGDALEFIGIEAGVGGRCFEEGPHGFRCDWGRVLEWQPPRRLLITWQISFARVPVPDPASCSEIEVSWSPQDGGTTALEFCHRNFERHGEGWEEYLAAMSSQGGWPFILDRYVAKAEQERGLRP